MTTATTTDTDPWEEKLQTIIDAVATRSFRATAAMVQIEREHNSKDIRVLMLRSMWNSPRQRDAGHRLGIQPATFSHWVMRLGIEAEIDAVIALQGAKVRAG